ncbi:ABC transporter ATP-binding protein [Alphaproteobacteria bacterium LSUCC0684]
MLTFENVSHAYGETPSVEDISIQIRKGEVVSLLGPSGCGKSTILRLASGLEKLRSGTIMLDGRVVASADMFIPPEERGIGLVFQDYALFPHMSVRRNILFGLDGVHTGMSREDKEARVNTVLEHVDLAGLGDVMPDELSGGQQQRVALARALAPEPRLILMDEPYAGLDSRLRERIRDDMLHILKETGTAVLMVTHDSEEAMFMSDRIYVMRSGRIEQTGRPIDLYCRPSNAFVAEFFGEVNRVEGVIRQGHLVTPLGEFDMPEGTTGHNAALIIRNEGLVIGNGSKPNAEVMETRLLGRYSLVHLSMPLPGGEDLHLHARVPGLNMLSPGQQVTLSVDPSQVFIFAEG